MIFSYRTRQFLRRVFRFFTVLVILAVVLLICWLLWLQRFLIYTPEGVRLDFSLSQTLPEGITAAPPEPGGTVSIYYGEVPEEAPPPEEGLHPISGYYTTVNELVEDLPGVLSQLEALPQGTAVLLDVCGYWGYFFYPSAVGSTTSSSFDMDVMEDFFATVDSLGLYTIARMPSFRNYEFAMNHFACGLQLPGGYLYTDPDRCYWLNPTDDTVLTYLIQIANELQGMGFDEVLFQYFEVPEVENLLFTADRREALGKAAKTLVTACATDTFTVSFCGSDPGFPLPEGKCRLYLQNVAAADVEDVLQQLSVSDPDKRIVFLAETNDTRYNVCSVLRPIDMAHP